jgi:SAM-dependent methyltransferase
MYPENARWIRDAIAPIALPAGARAIDVGSNTLEYRTVAQPHVESEVMAPVRGRGIEITHLDVQEAPGVDLVRDLDGVGPELADEVGRFELVLFLGSLAYVRDPVHVAEVVSALVADDGWLVATSPGSYRRTYDPHDNMLRPSPAELAAMFEPHGLGIVRAETVRVDDGRYYRGLRSRASWFPIFGRWWFPLPGFSERIRYRVPSLRWRESCLLMHRPR